MKLVRLRLISRKFDSFAACVSSYLVNRLFKSRVPSFTEPVTVVVFKLDNAGDIVLSSLVMPAVAEALGEASIYYVVKKGLGIPTVFSAYDNWALCPKYCLIDSRGGVCEKFHGFWCAGCVPMKKKPFVAFRKQVFSSFVKGLDAIAALTGSERERYLKSGVGPEKVHVLPLPLFMDNEEASPSADAVEAGTILFVGRIEREKGLHVLVEAMAMVLERFKNAKVLVVGEHSGSDRYKREVTARIEELGMGKVFSFLGKMGNSEIKELLLKSHVVVAPEQWAIAWPIFLTEAMSLGKRIVASRIGDIPAFIDGTGTGYLAAHDRPVDFGEKILAALEAQSPVNAQASLMIRKLCDRRAITKKLFSIYESAF